MFLLDNSGLDLQFYNIQKLRRVHRISGRPHRCDNLVSDIKLPDRLRFVSCRAPPEAVYTFFLTPLVGHEEIPQHVGPILGDHADVDI